LPLGRGVIESLQRTCPPPDNGQGEEPAVNEFLRSKDEGDGRRGGVSETNGVPRKGFGGRGDADGGVYLGRMVNVPMYEK
jgi:hypothetical protein